MRKKPAPKDDKKPNPAKEEKPKYEELVFVNLSRPQMTFDRTGYAFTLLMLDVFFLQIKKKIKIGYFFRKRTWITFRIAYRIINI